MQTITIREILEAVQEQFRDYAGRLKVIEIELGHTAADSIDSKKIQQAIWDIKDTYSELGTLRLDNQQSKEFPSDQFSRLAPVLNCVKWGLDNLAAVQRSNDAHQIGHQDDDAMARILHAEEMIRRAQNEIGRLLQ